MNLETMLTEHLWNAVHSNYEKRNFTGAILDAFYFLSELLRTKSGLEGDGAALIGHALGGATPKVKLNRLQTESDSNVQRGMEQTIRGLYQSIRNPRSHDKYSDSEEDAQAIILFIGYIAKQIDQAKAQFSSQDFVRRILDPDFVPQSRYAKLLVSEIPKRARLDTFTELYKSLENWKPEHMRHFLAAFVEELSSEEVDQVYEILTEELKSTDSDTTARVIIGSFPAFLWPKIGEVARLRIENKLIRSVRDGRHDAKLNRILSGSLGTWSTTIFSQMTLKSEMLSAVSNKLMSKTPEERAYVFSYLFGSLSSLSANMPPRIEIALRSRLRAGDKQTQTNLAYNSPWEKENWTSELQATFEHFVALEPVKNTEDDDIPF